MAEPVSDPKLAEAVERVGHLADWFGWRSGHTPTKGDDRGRRRVWLDLKEAAADAHALRTVIESLERLKAELAEAKKESPVSRDEANELQDILRTLTNSGTALKTSARGLVVVMEAARKRAEKAEAELAEANKIIEDMVGMEPCPKCGTGISATCLGCELAAANERAEKSLRLRIAAILRASVLEEAMRELDAIAMVPDNFDRISEIRRKVLAPAPPTDEPAGACPKRLPLVEAHVIPAGGKRCCLCFPEDYPSASAVTR